MKKINKLPLIILFALTVLLAVSVFGLARGKKASADTYNLYSDPYSFEFESYDVTYDVSSNRKIDVTELITVHFTGIRSTGFMKDIPVNGKELVRDVRVWEVADGVNKHVDYKVTLESNDFITVDIGDYSNKTNKTYTYLIKYEYCLTKAQEGKNALALNVIGLGRDCEVKSASVTLKLPEGLETAKYMIGSAYRFDETTVAQSQLSGGVIKIDGIHLNSDEGITFEMTFKSGSLTTFTDYTPYLYSLIGLAVLALVIILKLFVFNKNQLMPVVNYEAPNKMDPLLMGKLIDNKVDSEDVTSLIYYWASKGYIKINLDDKDDPTLIRVMQTLPEPCTAYEKIMYKNLFKGEDVIKPSQLKNSFYKTVDQVTAMVNKQTKGLYSGKSIAVSLIFAAIGGLLLGFVPFMLAITQISSSLFVLAPFISVVPLMIIYAFAESLAFYRLKIKKRTFALMAAGIGLIYLIVGLFYVFLVPDCIIGLGPKAVIYVLGAAISALSVTLINRTPQYTEKLNDIMGFKNFIQLAEKDQLEMMLEENPQFYYNVLPYAQVLGVSDKWEEKFASLTVQPPQWLTGNVVTTYIEFSIINNILRSSMGKISTGMVSRPSSSGSSGFGGSFGGGSIGGGHGGGGFRGR